MSLRALTRDVRGSASTTALGFGLTWFVVFFVFLMNVQLAQLFHRRDVVDHAAALATDRVKKTYCAAGEDHAASESAALRDLGPLLETATSEPSRCALSVRTAAGGSEDPGARGLDVALSCSFDCKIPIAAQVMCKGGRVAFEAKRATTSLGCDGKGG